MASNWNENDEQRRLETHESARLSDGREALGQEFGRDRAGERERRALGDEFAEQNVYEGRRLGQDFADPNYADQHLLGEAFADPNSLDDTKLGESFVETNSSRKKHHRSPARLVHDGIEEPLRRSGAGRTIVLVAVCVLLLMAIGLFIGWLPRHNTEKAAKQVSARDTQVPEIEVVKVVKGKEGSGLVVPGTTTPLTQSAIYARANGFLKKRYVDIGDHVHKGQLMALIDAPDLDQQVDQARRQVEQARAQLVQQEAQLALTKVTVDRYRVLVARGVFSRQDGDQAEANYATQVANVAASARNVDAYQANYEHEVALQSYERVTAPFDGVVTARNIDQGDLIQSAGSAGGSMPGPTASTGTTMLGATNNGGTTGSGPSFATPTTGTGGQGGALFTVSNDQRMRILVSVPEGYNTSIKPGGRTAVVFQEYPDAVFHGTITRTAASLDLNTRTELVEVQVDNHDGKLLPGMYAVVTFPPTFGGQPLLLTGDAVAIRNDRPTVALIASDNTVHLTPVSIGRDLGSEVEIVGGLREGQVVAATFTDQVVQGAKIKPVMDKQAEEAATPPSTPVHPNPPGNASQYGDNGIIDQSMQGQNATKSQKKPAGGQATKAANKAGTQTK